ncbi:MAG: ATP-binding cassette domain-containing protein, partial [Lachnospiraceae bacterium]|nr:ATP-binding cassette domain-containing protein [Lachnospiraceae bacterium]
GSGEYALNDIDMHIASGESIGIIGGTGSGKSSLINLVSRLYDVSKGEVLVGGNNVKTYDLETLRNNVAVVLQKNVLFSGTILENLRYAKDDATMEEIEEACRKASIHDFIAAQPLGYDTQVGNRGLKLSGGEKQRISIARVILKDPKILILDEATSALDSISENAIQEALETMMQGRTSIVIAHRLSTILKAEKILVVSGGVIAEQGTHEELLAKDGIYRELYETQFRTVIDNELGEKSEDKKDEPGKKEKE